MGYTIKNKLLDDYDDFFQIGDEVEILTTKEKGIIVMQIGNIYQIKREDGTISNYGKMEIEKRL